MHVHVVLHSSDCGIFLKSLFHGAQPLVHQVLLIIETSKSVSHTPHSMKLSRRVTSPTKEPQPDNTQHSQERDIHVPGEIRNCSPSKWRPQTHDLEREGPGMSKAVNITIIIVYRKIPQHDINELQRTAKLGTEHLLLKVLVYCTKGLWWEIALNVKYIVTTQ